MKPSFESVSSPAHTSFLVRQFEERSFSAPYHFHPEYELTLILKGCGKRYVGAHMCDYFPGDLVLLGANLPHCWKTELYNQADMETAGPSDDASLKDGPAQENSTSVVIQFRHDFMGKDFFNSPEMSLPARLLTNSRHGIQFTGDTVAIQQKMVRLLHEDNTFKKLMLFLDILHELACSPHYILLNRQDAHPELSIAEKERMNAVIAYIVENFQNKISLKDAASVANMTPHAFCKYFKRMNRKTFIAAVTGYRIDLAVRQLIHTDKSIAQIGFDSGFNDISNFHKTFKARMKLSPLNYRTHFMKKLV